MKILSKIWVQIFQPYPPWEGGIKMGVIKKVAGELKLQNMIFKAHKIRLNPKDEPSILKIDRVIVLFVTQPEAKISIK